MNNEILEEIQLFKFFSAPLAFNETEQIELEAKFLSAIEEDVTPKMAIAKTLSCSEHKIIFQLNCFSGCSYEERQLLDINQEFNQLSATYGLKEDFVWKGNGGRTEAVKAYNDWLEEQDFQAVYWIEEMYAFMIFIKPKKDIENILNFATRHNLVFQPVLASKQIPSYLHEIKERENLKNLLEKSAKEANKLNKHLFLYANMEECRPCCILDNSLTHPKLEEAFEDVYILKIDILDWMAETRLHFLEIMSAPFFIYITPEGNITEHTLGGDAWGDEDTPENMAKALKPYFKNTQHKAKKISQQEANDAISFAMHLTKDAEHLKWMIEESNYKINDKSATLLYNAHFLEKDLKFAEYLLENGAYLESSRNDMTPLLHAIIEEKFLYAKLLLQYEVDINALLPNGQNILFLLINEFWEDDSEWNEDSTWDEEKLLVTLKYWISQGADVKLKDNEGNSLLDYIQNFEATKKCHYEVVKYLQETVVL